MPQRLIPGVGWIDETSTAQRLIPGVGWVDESAGTPDTTPPTVTSVSGTDTGSTSATVSASSTEAGPGWAVLTPTSTQPSAPQVEAGQDHTGSSTGVFLDTASLAIGANPAAFAFTGLTPGATYWPHVVAKDTASPVNVSAVESGPSFTMPAPDLTDPVFAGGTTLDAGTKTNSSIALSTSAVATDNIAVTGYEWSSDNGATYPFTSLTNSFTFTALADLTSYNFRVRAYDAAGNRSAHLSLTTSTYRAGDTAANVIANTAATGGNPAGVLYALALTKSAGDWMAYRTISGPTPGTGTLTENANGSFTFVGPDPALWTIQPEVNGVDDAGGQIVVELYDQASDVTPPALTTATGTKTGATTATGTVTTSEGLGTLYYLTNTSPTALSAAVLAGSTQTVTAIGVQNISRTGLTAATTYYHHFLHKDPAGNDSAVLSSNSFTTDAVADTTAPTLTSPTGATLGPNGAVGSVSTNEANGTLYWLTNTSATATDAAIKAANSQAVTATGVQSVTSSGLTASTLYYNHFLHRDAAGNDSTRSTSASFTTAAPGAPVTGSDHGGEAMRSCMRPAMYPAMNKG